MLLTLPKTLLKFFSWPKFDEGCWNYHMIQFTPGVVFILPSRGKKAVLAIILALILVISLP